MNRFSYVRNNPIRYIDPTGHVCSDPEDPTPSCENGAPPPPVTTPPPPPAPVVIINPDSLDDGQEQDDPGDVVTLPVEFNPPVVGLVVVALLLHPAIVLTEIGLIAGEVVLAPMIPANPLVLVPIEIALIATSVALLDLDVAYLSYTYQVITNPQEHHEFEILPPWGFDQ